MRSILTLLLLLPLHLMGQKGLYLVPMIGAQSFFCSEIKNKGNSHPSFRPFDFNIEEDFGISLRYQSEKLLRLSVLLSSGAIAYGYGFSGSVNDSVNSYFIRRRSYSGTNYTKLSFNVERHLVSAHWFPLGTRPNGTKKYAMAFYLYLYSGLAINLTPVQWIDGDTSSNSGVLLVTPGIATMEEETVLRKYNPFLQLGLTMQFQGEKRQGAALSLVYNFGMFRFTEVQVDYSIMQEKYQSFITTRGNTINLQLSYPIRVLKCEKKK